jgi:hypothetical protein
MLVSFCGDLTIRTADVVRSRLQEALTASGDGEDVDAVIDLDCFGAEEVDQTFLQLVISARKSAAVLGRTLRMATPANDVLRAALFRCGLLGQPGETAWPEDEFWTTAEVSHE